MTLLGKKPTEPGEHRPRGREAERILAGELLDAFRHFAQTQTEFAERLQGRLVNHVLAVETITIPASGVVSRQWHAAAGAIEVTNLSAAGAITTVPASTVGANPAAGAEVSATVPAGETWQLDTVDFTLVTSATVATRRMQLIIDDGVNILAKIVAAVDQAASLSVEYTFTAGGVETAAVRNGVLQLGIPPMVLGAGYRIRTVTAALQAGDDYGAPVIGYRRTTTTAGSNPVTVEASGPGGAPSDVGVGVSVVPAGMSRVIALASRQVSIYGTPGDKIVVQVFTAAPAPVI